MAGRWSFYLMLRDADIVIDELANTVGISSKFYEEDQVHLLRIRYCCGIDNVSRMYSVPSNADKLLTKQAKRWIKMKDYVFRGSTGKVGVFNFHIPGVESIRTRKSFYNFDDVMDNLEETTLFDGMLWIQMKLWLRYLEALPAFNFRLPIVLDCSLVCFLNISKYTHTLKTGSIVHEYQVELIQLEQRHQKVDHIV